ncbi:MAG: GntR family transcriptional regulator [Parvibaculaceae bacterium]
MADTPFAVGDEPTDLISPVRKGGRTRINSIYQCLRDRICFFEYPPNTVLREASLAQEFGVSRTPIRQILQMLESERLVEIRDGVGTIVTGVDFRRLRDVYDLRLRLTELIGDFGSKQRAREAASEIEELIERTEHLKREPDLRAFWAVESDRHRLINSLIANEPLREIHDSLYIQTSRVWYDIVESVWSDALEALSAELRELQRALNVGDLPSIGFASRNYIAYAMTRLSRHFDPA